MGELIQAECPCGLRTGKLTIGIGFNMKAFAPAYCDDCGKVKSIEAEKDQVRCTKCKRLMTYYEHVYTLSEDPMIDPDKYHYCPRCKSNSLKFIDVGMWD